MVPSSTASTPLTAVPSKMNHDLDIRSPASTLTSPASDIMSVRRLLNDFSTTNNQNLLITIPSLMSASSNGTRGSFSSADIFSANMSDIHTTPYVGRGGNRASFLTPSTASSTIPRAPLEELAGFRRQTSRVFLEPQLFKRNSSIDFLMDQPQPQNNSGESKLSKNTSIVVENSHDETKSDGGDSSQSHMTTEEKRALARDSVRRYREKVKLDSEKYKRYKELKRQSQQKYMAAVKADPERYAELLRKKRHTRKKNGKTQQESEASLETPLPSAPASSSKTQEPPASSSVTLSQ